MFSKLLDFVQMIVINEPVIIRFVAAGIALAAAFGIPVQDQIVNSITDALGVLATLVLAFSARSKVTPVANPNLEG